MSLAQFCALSAPALLGILAIVFGLFELHRIRRVKASFAGPTVTGMQDSTSVQVSGATSETPQSTLAAVSPSDQPAPVTSSAETTKQRRPSHRTLEEIEAWAIQQGHVVFKDDKSKGMTVIMGAKPLGSAIEGIPEFKLELSKAMDEIATAHNQLAEAKHKLNEAVDKIAHATASPQENTGS
ncbi:MAG TPA: hypothetical protein VGO49_14780 [Bradyrhizobium sp.]|jgi:hypothetical protein|nr:hypothetical protein [Bradyrhizobium sp.]